MAYENILFHKTNMATLDGYFYLFDYPRGLLEQKTADGSIAFQYPIDIPEGFTDYSVDEVVCLQYDGYSLWTLQDFTAGDGVIIRQWIIDNYVCVLEQQFPKINQPSVITYDVDTFSVEYYTTVVTNDISDGALVINIDEYVESVIFPGTVIGIGYNKYDEREQVTVSGVSGQDIYLTEPISKSYFAGDKVVITPSIMMFNNYYGTSSDTGTLTLFNPNNGLDISTDNDVEYKGITASKFTRLQNVLQAHPDVHTLTYVKGTNLKLRDMSDLYRYNAVIRASDNFDGLDLSLPDETKWVINSGDPKIYNNKLFCSTVGVGHDSIDSTYLLIGDFSIQVSGTVGDMTVFPGSGINNTFYHYMGLTFSGDPSMYKYGLNYFSGLREPYSGAILDLRFEGNALDSSINGYHGTLVSSPTLAAGVDGAANSAYDFNSVSHIRVDNELGLEVGKDDADFSVSFWLKFNNNTNSNFESITHKGTADTDRTFAIWRIPYSNLLHYRISTTAGYNEGGDTVTPLVRYVWSFITYVKEGNVLSLYIDGRLDHSTVLTGTSISNTGPIYIGDDPWYPGITATVDNYRIYSKALSLNEVATLMDADLYGAEEGPYDATRMAIYTNSTERYSDVLASGIAQYDYNLKAERIVDKLHFSYQTLTSGIPNMPWETTIVDVYTTDCLFSMGLSSNLITVSGSYFDNLECTYGYLRYPAGELPYYGIMGMDNVQTDQSTIHTIYDIDIEGDDLYRLQQSATYYGGDYTWATYNFQVSPIRSFVDFITVDADSHVIPATGRNTTPVRSITLDQYGQGVVNRPVTFTDDDDVGFITTEVVYTDIFYNTGRATTAYTSGTDLRIVNINAKVTQLD